MHRDTDTLPLRHVGRVANQFLWDIGSVVLAVVPRDIDGAALLMMMLRSALRGNEGSALSIHAIAQSLRRPPETMRRAAGRLADMGLCERLERGFALPADFLRLPPIEGLQSAIANRTTQLLGELETAGLLGPGHARDQGSAALAAAATDIYLSVFELAESRIRQPVLLHIHGTVTVMNVAALTRDPALGLRYGHDDTVPPEALRRRVTVQEVSRASGFPYATVWRHIATAVKLGLLREAGGGYLLADRLLHDPETTRRLHTRLAYLRRVLADLDRGAYAVRT